MTRVRRTAESSGDSYARFAGATSRAIRGAVRCASIRRQARGRFVDGGRYLKTQAAGRTSLGVFSTPDAMKARVISIVEGPIDALSLALCGLPAVAMIGTSWAKWLPEALVSKSVFIATDADDTGDKAAERLNKILATFDCKLLRLRPYFGKDWNDVLAQDLGGINSLRAIAGFE